MGPASDGAAARPDWLRYVLLWVQMAFGSHSLISGLNHFVPLFRLSGGDPALSPIGPFMGAMIDVGLYDWVKLIELVVGLCLLSGVFVPAAALIELPISIVIFYLCVVIDRSPNIVFSGVRELGFNLFIVACYARPLLGLAVPRSEPSPLWRAPRR
ncbi:MAG: hypothetical protein JWN59_755 [Sphingomonas bacterium]|nr:hypothetical protein [Sphingomonas bacterium]